jgi:hypothetical protein
MSLAACAPAEVGKGRRLGELRERTGREKTRAERPKLTARDWLEGLAMAEIQWWYARGDEQLGPVSAAELRRLAATAALSPNDLVWREGMAEWAPAVRVKGLFPEPAAPVAGATGAAKPAAAKPEGAKADAAKPDSAKHGAAKLPVAKHATPRPEPASLESVKTAEAGDAAVGEALSQSFATKETGELPPPVASSEDPLFASFLEPTAGVPLPDIPPPPSPLPVAPAPIGPALVPPSERQRISYSHLATILAVVQGVLWGACVLVILLGGLLFTWGRLRAHTHAEEAASATIFGTFFIGAYVIARAGEKISGLVLKYSESRRGL